MRTSNGFEIFYVNSRLIRIEDCFYKGYEAVEKAIIRLSPYDDIGWQRFWSSYQAKYEKEKLKARIEFARSIECKNQQAAFQ